MTLRPCKTILKGSKMTLKGNKTVLKANKMILLGRKMTLKGRKIVLSGVKTQENRFLSYFLLNCRIRQRRLVQLGLSQKWLPADRPNAPLRLDEESLVRLPLSSVSNSTALMATG